MKSLNIIKKRILNYIWTRRLPILVALGYTIVVLSVILNRFWQFEVFYYDHGYYDSTIWKISKFKEPIVEYREIGRFNIFSDHFIPSLFVFSPLYWFTDRYEPILIVLAVTVGISVLVAYEIAKKFIKNQALIFSLLFAYMFYVGMQNALIFFVHPTTMMILPLMLLFWAVFNNKIKLFYLLLFFNLGFKETVVAITLMLGIFLFFYKKEWRKHGITTVLISIFYGLIVTKLIMPHFNPGGRFSWEPNWPSSVMELFRRFTTPPVKLQTVFASFATFGFLPILAPFFLPVIFQDFLLRFVLGPQAGFRWDLGLHYNVYLDILLFIGSVLAVYNLQKWKIFNRLGNFYAIAIFVIVIVLHRFVYHGPFGLFYNLDFYKHTGRQDFMWNFINKIPKDGKLMLQNNIAVFFTHRDLHILSSCEGINEINPDVVAFDFRPGQNVNNWWPLSDHEMKQIVSLLKNDPSYKILFNDDFRYIFRKEVNRQAELKCP